MKRVFVRMRRVFGLPILAFIGPGFIASAAGNDAGGIATYSVAGAQFGYQLLWVMVPLTIGFVLIQEMSARLGAATGKGFSDLMRENFSLRATIFMMGLLFVANAGIVVSEFVGIAASLELFGISKYISIPIAGAIIWWMIVKGNYPKVEKLFILMSLVLFSYIITTFLIKPDPLGIVSAIFKPTVSTNPEYIYLLLALIGTTIAPFMQIYAQSSVVEKGITMSDFKYERIDTLIGTLFANIVAIFIMIATASTLYPAGIRIDTAADAARALVPFAGNFATVLFGIGLLGASLLAAGVVPLTTSFAIANAFGWESGVNRSLDEAPVFYSIFTVLIVMSATITLTPAISFIKLLIGFSLINGLLLPIQLIYMMRLANNSQIMGKYTNGKVFNFFAWGTTVFVSTAALLFVGGLVFRLFRLVDF